MIILAGAEADMRKIPSFWILRAIAVAMLLIAFVAVDNYRHPLLVGVPIFVVLILAGSVIPRVTKRQRRKCVQSYMARMGILPAQCFKCRYDLRGSTSATCPECGEILRIE